MQRIISLVPSQTELLADLGLEEEVVGITKFCVHPERWFRTKTRIGGTKTVDLEKVKALQPDIILANKEENVKEQIEALEKIAPVYVSNIHTLVEAQTMILDIGKLFGKVAASKAMVAQIREKFQHLKRVNGLSVAYCIWQKPWMWAGGDTFIHDMLVRTGFENVFKEIPRYPTEEIAALQERKPDLIFLSSEPFPFKEKHAIALQKELPKAKIVLVDGEMFSWYGSRLLLVPHYLATLIASL